MQFLNSVAIRQLVSFEFIRKMEIIDIVIVYNLLMLVY